MTDHSAKTYKVAVFQEIFKQSLGVSKWFAVAPIQSSKDLAFSKCFYIYSLMAAIFLDIMFVAGTLHHANKYEIFKIPRLLNILISLILINWEVYKNIDRLPRWIEYFNGLEKICGVSKGSISSRKCLIIRFILTIFIALLYLLLIVNLNLIVCYENNCFEWQVVMEIISHSTISVIVNILTVLNGLLIILIYFVLVYINTGLMKLQVDKREDYLKIRDEFNIDVSDFSYRPFLRKGYHDTQLAKVASEIRSYASSYLFVVDTIKTIGRCDGLSVLLSLLLVISRLTTYGYVILLTLCCMGEFDTISLTSWAVFHFCRILLIIEPCHRTHEQMEESMKLINQLAYFWSEYDPILNELDLLKRTIELNDVTISPLNLFTLDRLLVIKVLGCALTYFIIMYQFSDSLLAATYTHKKDIFEYTITVHAK
ncbi:gustatory receptor for sugar taste 43a-like [Colias croceus]|uniref:gustatory receptor for sugar taste 43a-like n=1 Tax=Colias crocea TaxID=72248 RepID=UPI001E27B22C|nr:gustatory receptor for sugar taste 43a-like [Colias croceus]